MSGWDRMVKTKENYFSLVREVFAYALKHDYIAANPATEMSPEPVDVHQPPSAASKKMRVLTQTEVARAVELASAHGDLLAVAVATGLSFGEITALWVGDVDAAARTIRVTKMWKRNGNRDLVDQVDRLEVPGWLVRQLAGKHEMRGNHLGAPTTPKAKRTITLSPVVAGMLTRRIEGKAGDDFAFTTRRGLPWHPDDFSNHVWTKLMTKLEAEGIARFVFGDLRHTHAAWLIAAGVPLHEIQARLGHESIATTTEIYRHLLPTTDDLISGIVEAALTPVDQ